jgi:hypothetical protein
MTEIEWLACTDPRPMLGFLEGKASDRKLRLFACACCRQLWHLLKNESSRRAVEGAERFADGLVSLGELDCVYESAEEDYWLKTEDGDESAAAWAALSMLHELPDALQHAIAPDLENKDLRQPFLLRCIFGPLPFRLVPLDPSWLAWNGGTIPKLAEAIYNDWAFDRLPILADALEDAGCNNAELLGHLRGPGPHARGCWALDLVLGRS